MLTVETRTHGSYWHPPAHFNAFSWHSKKGCQHPYQQKLYIFLSHDSSFLADSGSSSNLYGQYNYTTVRSPCNQFFHHATRYFLIFLRDNPLLYHLIRNRAAFKKLSLSLVGCTVTKFTLSSVIQARRIAGSCDGCLQEGERLRGKRDDDQERRKAYFHLIFTPPSTSTQLWSTCGDDGTRPASGKHAKHCVTVKWQIQTIKPKHALSLNKITWRLWMANPLKPDQRKSEFWSGLWLCVYMQKEWIRVAIYMTTACNPVREYSPSCLKQLCLLLLAWKTAQMNVREWPSYLYKLQ